VLLVLDIGGGSFEIAVGTGEQPDVAISLPLGAGRLTRDFNLSDPPTSKEVKELQKYVRQEIANVVSEVSKPGLADHVVGTSKTFRSLARIAGAAPSSEGPRERRFLWDTDLREITDELVGMSRKERTNLPGVSASRAEQLAAGAIVASTAVDLLNVEVVEIGPWALREGILLKHIDGMHR
jgi:exopolyphosphatase/guanosine-5'-triphosphate,3'-diphosphate pyrophosphatase